MLYLHQSNRTERLFETLTGVLEKPLQAVLQPEIIVVEEPGMSRWLAGRLADRRGIAANIGFPLPAGFVWQVINGQLGTGMRENTWSKPVLHWMIMALLPGLEQTQGFESIRQYLQARDRETRLYQLSREIADLFDQYLVYRSDWIQAWEAGHDNHWQAQLWRAMRRRNTEPHWASLLDTFCDDLKARGLQSGVLPERVCLFCLSSLSPGYMKLLTSLGRVTDIHLFLINPSEAYWGDIESEKRQARIRDTARRHETQVDTSLFDIGHPLLASMGNSRREFIDLWWERETEGVDISMNAGDPPQSHLLGLLQGDMLTLGSQLAEQKLPLEDDVSIQVHSCYSPLREVEALHDALLSLFGTLPGLAPHDIAVFAPDISAYAPFIEAVFGAVPQDRRLPYSISGQSLANEPVVELVLQWLLLPRDRFEASTVMGWLNLAPVQRRFNLHPAAVERIREWVADSGIRWGLDAGHREALGLPASDINTWAFGLRRLYLGYTLPPDTDLFMNVAPSAGIEGSETTWLGELQRFINALMAWRQELARPATMEDWQKKLGRLIEQLLLPDADETIHLDSLRRQMNALTEQSRLAGFTEEVSAALLHQHLSAALGASGGSFSLLSGRVTCTSLTPARSVPFRVVCLLGMNDGSFPRNRQAPGFDLMAASDAGRRKGDRRLSEDDRFLFLEALLSARDVFYMSFVGRSQQDNSEKQPSVVVSELLDVIEESYGEQNSRVRECILRQHPLQPFSPRAFAAGSYAGEWYVASGKKTPRPFFKARLPVTEAEDDSVVALDHLAGFLAHPAKYFLQCLGVQAAEYDVALEDSEAFALDHLAAYMLKSQLLGRALEHHSTEDTFIRMNAAGELPHGALAEETFIGLVEDTGALLSELEPLQDQRVYRDLSFALGGATLQGRILSLQDGGALGFRPSDPKPKDLLRLWVGHLALCCSGHGGTSRQLGQNKSVSLYPVEPQRARELLMELLILMKQGRSELVPLIENSSRAYASVIHRDDSQQEQALGAALKAWEPQYYARGDRDDLWTAQAWQGRNPFDDSFCAVSTQVWLPLLDSIAGGKP